MMGSRRLGSCCPRFALNGKSRWLSKCATFAARTPDTGNITGRVLAHPFTDSAGVLLLTTLARSPPLTLEAAGVSLWSFPPQFWFARPPTGACRERNVPVMLGIRLSRCWVIIIDYQAKSVKIVSRIFLISSGTYSNALCNAST